MKALQLCLLLLILSGSVFSVQYYSVKESRSKMVQSDQSDGDYSPRVVLPLYVKLQSLERGNVTLWESVPVNFSDHVATVESRLLAMFIPANSLGFHLRTDNIDKLWFVGNFSLEAGQFISTLAYVSSRTTGENLSSLGSVLWPGSYPDDVKDYLEQGRKIESENQTIQAIAASYIQPTNMTQTVKDVLDYVNTQDYDPAKTRLLLSGNLNTTDVLDVFKDALRVYDTNSSICLERSWYAAAILRAAGVPTRTVSDVRLKTWIQVWLPGLGWVDGETLCQDSFPHRGMLPKPLTTSVPWVVQNSSDAIFPLMWTPRVQMRVANLTFSSFRAIRVSDYSAVLAEPINEALFKTDPSKFRFPVAFRDDSDIYAALTRDGEGFNFSLFKVVENKVVENASRTLTLGQAFSISLGNTVVSFEAIAEGRFVVLQAFVVQEVWSFDTRLLVPVFAVPVALVAVWLLLKRRRSGQ